MSIITTTLLAIGGSILLIFNRPISRAFYEIQRPAYKWMFGRFVNLEKPWFQKLYKWAVIFGGIILILMAYASYFGPITL